MRDKYYFHFVLTIDQAVLLAPLVGEHSCQVTPIRHNARTYQIGVAGLGGHATKSRESAKREERVPLQLGPNMHWIKLGIVQCTI